MGLKGRTGYNSYAVAEILRIFLTSSDLQAPVWKPSVLRLRRFGAYNAGFLRGSVEKVMPMATYKDAGVDIKAGEAIVRRIAPLVQATYTDGVLGEIGAFGGFFALNIREYQHPVLVSSMDGVGTKLKVALLMERYDSVGQDLVNHCVNDIAVSGAEPLFFLDYYATGVLNPDISVSIVRGFSEACLENQCALIGGETAEMPDIYFGTEFDLVGTVVGVVEKENILGSKCVENGDTLIGIRSSGLHTNGYTLARKVLFSRFGVHDRPDELDGASVGEVLLSIHRSYLSIVRAIRPLTHAFVHVTGGGVMGNTLRVVTNPLIPSVNFDAWDRPAIFHLIQRLGNVPEEDMRSTFNLGIGLIAVVPDPQPVVDALRMLGEDPVIIGCVDSTTAV